MGGEREDVIDEPRKKKRGGTIQGGKPEGAADEDSVELEPPATAAEETMVPAGPAGLTSGAGLTPAQALVRAALGAGAVGGTLAGLGGQKVRFHESGGEVHFHVDAEGLKAAVKTGVAWDAWQRCVENLQPFVRLDRAHGTVLTLTPRLEGDDVEVYVNVAPCRGKLGANAAKLNRTING